MKWALYSLLILTIAMPVIGEQKIVGTKDSTDDEPFVMLGG
ncbi:MAG: hypothetical protein ACUVWP_00050 [bacterium]